jgi:hypothetical protein
MRTPSTADDDSAPGGDAEPKHPAAGSSDTHSLVKGRQGHRLPHERDESSDSGTAPPGELMQVAHDDARSERKATDRGEQTDEVYGRTLRGDTPGDERDGDRGKGG